MNRLVIFLLFFGFQSMVIGQTPVLIKLEGTVQDFVTGQKLYGATVNVIQNESSVSRVITDIKGNYYVSAKVIPAQIVAVVVAFNGYMTKKLSFDLKTIVPKANTTNAVMLIDQLPLQLYVIRPNVDLNFTKEGYAEKFVWDQSIYKAIPDAQLKADMDKKVKDLYKIAKDKEKLKAYVASADLSVSRKEFDKAVKYYDSALVVSPTDVGIIDKKKAVQTIIDINESEAKRKKEFDKFKLEGDAAYAAKNWKLAEQQFKLADQQIPKDAYIIEKLTRIKENIELEAKNVANKAQYDKTMQAVLTLNTAKKYDEALVKLSEAMKLQPNEKEKVEAEMAKINAIKEDAATEIEVKKLLKSAGENYTQKKYDLSIELYKKADLNIAKFKKQSLIDQYSKELQNGMKKVMDWKTSQEQIYKDQLAKAKENFTKGPQFYSVAKSILNSDPMKSRQNEPSVIELKEKISKMEAYYAKRKSAYSTVKSKNNELALNELKAVQTLATSNVSSLPATELPQLQKSIDSLINLTKVATTVVTKTTPVVKEDVIVGTQLKAPGERSKGTAEQAFNDLNKTAQQKAEQPQQKIQEIKDVFDYQNHFNEIVSAIHQETTDKNVEGFKAEQTMIDRKNQEESVERQADIQKAVQKNEVAVTMRNKEQEDKQVQNAQSISNWKDAKDVSNRIEQIAADNIQEAGMAASNRVTNQESLSADKLKEKEEKDLKVQQKMKTDYEISVSKRDTENAENQDKQYVQVQKMAASKLELTNTPNNLKDEDGVLFPKNAMTEQTYTQKNAQGFVTTVIIRRVVVDKNGYGVVFEQTTKEDGVNFFTRNGQIITDYIWFNESTGANVIEK
jgi:tetratricopeptide (TPR) repeat protein